MAYKTSPNASFELKWLEEVELYYYDFTINAVGLLEVMDLETGEYLYETDGTPWFLIEHRSPTKYYLDTSDKYFLIEDGRYCYRWLAYRNRGKVCEVFEN
jgi:hypothetical protein